MVSENYSGYDIEVFLDEIRSASGWDLSGYARPSLQRRIARYIDKYGIEKEELLVKLKGGKEFVNDFIQEVTVNYSEMFRDPEVYYRYANELLAYLESYPLLRIWSAGCAGGEEAYSLAIFLKESNLYDRTRIYATDINEKVLQQAREGVFMLSKMRQFSENYIESGGRSSLSDYYRVVNGKAFMSSDLRQNLSFAVHNLTGDGVFNEFNMICCRNVLIYFTQKQRTSVLMLLYESLSIFGFLCLGKREGLFQTGLEDKFKIVDKTLNIYQKIA